MDKKFSALIYIGKDCQKCDLAKIEVYCKELGKATISLA